MTDVERRSDLALVDRHDGFAVITMNRSEKRNAMNRAAKEALRSAFRSCRDVKAIVLTGAGSAFCAGEDLLEAREERVRGDRVPSRGSNVWFEVQEDIRLHPAVFIAAVNGTAVGGGLTLVNNCELAIAANLARFGLPEMSFGTFPSLSGASTLHRILPKHAARLIFTADLIDADEALRLGLVNEVTSFDELLPRAMQLAQQISAWDATLLDYGKRAYWEMMRLDWSRAIEYGLSTNQIIPSARGANSDFEDNLIIGGRQLSHPPSSNP